MSELTDLVIQFGERYGWELLMFLFILYQFYSPVSLKPGADKTKLQNALAKFHVLGIVVEAVAEEIESIDEAEVHEAFQDNGYEPEDFKQPSD